MKTTLTILAGFILLLVAIDFAAERRSPPEATTDTLVHPILREHPEAVRVPVFRYSSALWICSDSVATWYGHRPMEPWEREAYEFHQKPETED